MPIVAGVFNNPQFGASATPVALFAIGLGLGFMAIKASYKPTIVVIFAKMILAPLFFVFCLKIFNLELKDSTIVAIIENAAPYHDLSRSYGNES